MKTYVTVCKNTVLQNIKAAREGRPLKPPLRVSRGKRGKPTRHFEYVIPVTREALQDAKVRVVYDPEHPLPWGARAWVEVES